jgi:hypothetical protein
MVTGEGVAVWARPAEVKIKQTPNPNAILRKVAVSDWTAFAAL